MRHSTTRPLTIEEYKEIIPLIAYGFEYKDQGGNIREFRPNERLALVFQVQATTGLRIGDVLDLKPKHFKGGKMEVTEGKTKKLQYRKVAPELISKIYGYAMENDIKENELLFSIGVRAVQKQLKIVTDYLDLDNIGTHSFRKLYATEIYNNTKDIEVVRELLNHSSISTTQKYIKVSQEEIDKVSESINMLLDDWLRGGLPSYEKEDKDMQPDIDKLKEFMKANFGITPENIDEKLEEKRRELEEKLIIIER